MYVLETKTEKIVFDGEGRICSFQAAAAREQEFVKYHKEPAFELQYIDEDEMYQLDAGSAGEILAEEKDGRLTFTYKDFGGCGLEIVTSAFIEGEEIRLTFSVKNPGELCICQICFPMLILKYNLGGAAGGETLVRPYNAGQLIEAPSPEMLEADTPYAWMFRPENTDTGHYPGQTFAQFLAYYNDRAGIYAACDDTMGRIKMIKPVHRQGLRLGFLHAADWRCRGELGYSVILKGFRGDWCAAADIYRGWTAKQAWAVPLRNRGDIPKWLLASPVHLVFRMQGQLDEGSTQRNDCFLPYERNIPLLKEISRKLESPILPVLMAWEKNGPWVYPECFPMVGGDESLQTFCEQAKENGWHVGTYCNGTRWVTGHFGSGYDGQDFRRRERGEESFCRTHRQEAWRENWDSGWRESYAACLGTSQTQDTAKEFYGRLLSDGLSYIQFLDQNVGCSTFPCYSKEHGHVPMPDIWMTQEMKNLLAGFRHAGGQETAIALEQPCSECFIPDIHICDVRVAPPGHQNWKKGFFPLYQYLYHEYILLQGTFGNGQDPYHMQIKSAYNFVLGNMTGAVLDGDGEFISSDSRQPWGLWRDKISSQEQIVRILKNTAAVRRGIGQDYLVYGRMERSAKVFGIEKIRWEYADRMEEAPTVFHSMWKNEKGRHGVALVNWTDRERTISVMDERISAREVKVTVPPLDAVLIEEEMRDGLTD